ncbi:MAG: hypothetical protein R3C10_25665 [Pirellulales bacterium]
MTDDRVSTVNDVLLAYVRFAQGYYSNGGTLSKEFTCMKEAMRPLRKLYGRTAAAEFGPKKLKTVQREMIKLGWSRRYLNRQVGRIRRIFKWAASEELVSPSVHLALTTVAGIREGAEGVRDTEPIRPVADAVVEATLQHVAPPVGGDDPTSAAHRDAARRGRTDASVRH